MIKINKRSSLLILTIITCSSAIQGIDNHQGIYNDYIIHNQIKRTFTIFIPSKFNKNESMPLLIVLHGGGGTGERMIKLTRGQFNSLAEYEGFIVVYPDGIEKHWNDGRTGVSYRTHKEKIDDVGFISALIDTLKANFNIDLTRVYVTGISNGGFMAYRLSIDLGSKIAAIAPVAASMIVELKDALPSCPVPVLIINGTKDPLVPYEGGKVGFSFFKKIGTVISTSATVEFWVKNNGCISEPNKKLLPDKDPDDGTRVWVEQYGGGRDSSEVILYRIEGGGHTWPGGWQYLSERIVGKTCQDIEASRVIWDFFKKYRIK